MGVEDTKPVKNGDNPYLMHLPPSQRGSSASKAAPNPLEGLVPRMVTAQQARGVLVSQLFTIALALAANLPGIGRRYEPLYESPVFGPVQEDS